MPAIHNTADGSRKATQRSMGFGDPDGPGTPGRAGLRFQCRLRGQEGTVR